MKKTVYALLLMVNFLTFAQESKDKFSFEFTNTNIKSVIETIEKSSNYKFFFEQEWIDSNKTLLTVSFKDATIDAVLVQILNQIN
jgi:type II secretory pathway component GspD/PulD (secretin)